VHNRTNPTQSIRTAVELESPEALSTEELALDLDSFIEQNRATVRALNELSAGMPRWPKQRPFTEHEAEVANQISGETADRFWDKVDIQDRTSCWNWTAYTDRDGYGRFKLNGAVERAHRVALQLDGRDPTGNVARHTCDNPSCVNPHHLLLGTHEDNARDMVRRDRSPRGERNGQAKLSAEDIPTIRSDTRPSRVIAEEYGVSPSQIRRIRTGGSWSHLD